MKYPLAASSFVQMIHNEILFTWILNLTPETQRKNEAFVCNKSSVL